MATRNDRQHLNYSIHKKYKQSHIIKPDTSIKQFEDVSVTRQLRDNQIQLPRGGMLEYILWLVNIVQR